MQVINKSRVDFQYKLGKDEPIILKTIFSNRVITEIVNSRLKVCKKVDKKVACAFEVLKYTIVISNVTSNSIENVFFKDPIDKMTKFIEGSIRINGVKRRCINPNKGFNIGIIHEHSSIVIEFRVIILLSSSLRNINNQSYITYDYTYNIELPPKKITIVSNEVSIFVENKLFKQMSVGNILRNIYDISKVENDKYIDVKVKILKTKLVPSYMERNLKTCKLSLCKLIVIGSIEYFIVYKSKNINKSIKKIKIEGFSTFMMVPCGVEYCNDYKVNCEIENVLPSRLNEKDLFVDTEILLTL